MIENQIKSENQTLAELDISDDEQYIRCYKLRQLPPNGIQFRIKKMFSSVKACEVHSVVYLKKFMPSLSIIFGNKEDFDKASEFEIAIGNVKTKFTAVDTSLTDGNITIIPRIVKYMKVTGIPSVLLKNKEFINEIFQDIAGRN